MYEKLIDQGLNCGLNITESIYKAYDTDTNCCNCQYQKIRYPFCMQKLIADLTEALMTIESYNTWNEEAARHLKTQIDRIQFIEERR